jgi:hypothetical protein
MRTEEVLAMLSKVKANGEGEWMACCPAHDDKTPSLSIKEEGLRTLLKCFAGCTVQDIAGAIGIRASDLFNDRGEGLGAPPPFVQPKQPDLDEIWNRMADATDQHEYIRRKDGLPDGLKLQGEDLVIPARDTQGKLVTWQAIKPDGTKKSRKGEMGSSFFSIGERSNEAPVYVCEGVGQAWACYKATGRMSVACFGTGRFGTVSEAIRKAHSGPIVLVPDRGAEAEAKKAAVACKGLLWKPPESWEKNKDVNDFMREKAGNASLLEDMLLSAKKPGWYDADTFMFEAMRGNRLASLPPKEWLVNGVISRNGLSCVFGPPGAGKSFLLMDMMACICRGEPWFSHKTVQAPAILIAFEGMDGYGQRAAAYEKHHGRSLPSNFALLAKKSGRERWNVANQSHRLALAEWAHHEGLNGGITCLDTLSRATGDFDENSSQDMGRVIEGCDELRELIGGNITLVHHTGTNGQVRGSTALKGAWDDGIKIEHIPKDKIRRWSPDKIKDGPDDSNNQFELQVVWMDLVSSCVVKKP